MKTDSYHRHFLGIPSPTSSSVGFGSYASYDNYTHEFDNQFKNKFTYSFRLASPPGKSFHQPSILKYSIASIINNGLHLMLTLKLAMNPSRSPESSQLTLTNESVTCHETTMGETPLFLASSTAKSITVFSNIKNKFMLEGILCLLNKSLRKMFAEQSVTFEIENEPNELTDILIIETSEAKILFDCLAHKRNILMANRKCNIFVLPKDIISSLPCIQTTAVINENEKIDIIAGKIKSALKYSIKNKLPDRFLTCGTCKHQHQCQRRFLLPMEYKVISTFSITRSLNETAQMLSITPKKASSYKRSAMRKLCIDNNSDLLKFINDNF